MLRLSWLTKSTQRSILFTIISILIAFLIAGVLLLVVGVNPITAYELMIKGAFGSPRSISNTILKSIPIMLTGLGVSIAFRCKIWNIGAEGQLYMGAALATWLGIYLIGIPSVVHIPIVMLGGFLGGALWALIPGVLKAKLQISEVLVTVFMNSIAFLFSSYILTGPMSAGGGGALTSPPIAPSAQLPLLLAEYNIHSGLLIALLSAVVLYFFFSKTTLGYKIKAVGSSRKVANYGGISVVKIMLITMILSGGFAGLAGMVEVSGVYHSMQLGISPGYGFTGILVAKLGKLHPVGVVLSAFLFGALIIGVDSMARRVGLSIFLALVIQALIILTLLVSEYVKGHRFIFLNRFRRGS